MNELMKAVWMDPWKAPYPLLCTPKLDGIRCSIQDVPRTKSGKLVRNQHIVSLVSQLPKGTDGELIVPGAEFSDVQSAVMSEDGAPDFRYCIFDWDRPGEPYSLRIEHLRRERWPDWAEVLVPVAVHSALQFEQLERSFMEQGYEGTVARLPSGLYIPGRNVGFMKHKPMQDAEAEIVGFKESRTVERFGARWPKGELGALVLQADGVRFSIGTGYSKEQRQDLWRRRPQLLGKLARYTYQCIGSRGRPRFPAFLAIVEDS